MFDADTARLLRSAPGVPGLSPENIPALLTRHYTNLVSARLRGAAESPDEAEAQWPLERIADTYELITSLQTEGALRRASAFVAGTAQQILARRQSLADSGAEVLPNVDRDRVDPALAAALLFLAAEQYADANEAASAIRTSREGQLYEATILSEHIVDLAQGRLGQILDRAQRWRRPRSGLSLDERALAALLESLIAGMEMLAAELLNVPVPDVSASRFHGARDAFALVLALSTQQDSVDEAGLGGSIILTYAGPHHLASLLLAACNGIAPAALTHVPPPDGTDATFWKRWIRSRATTFPFVWPNHREAIAKGFHQTGRSAVVVLPTGAGKTTVSSLKIAGALARRKKVIFLAPTHALVEQLTEDLQEMFPSGILGSVVSSDFDLLFQTGAQLKEIEVMTPERCLATLSFAPEAFADVGLLVFDECHLLSPQSGKIRRAVDGMLCVLGFSHLSANADLLFLSAMLKNGVDFAEWISDLTGRPCVSVDLLWKPSRQARGVVIYRQEELDRAQHEAVTAQNAEDSRLRAHAKSLRVAAARKLVAVPWAIWGLQHNWLNGQRAICSKRQLLDAPVPLAGELNGRHIRIKPNANQVSAHLAVAAASHGLKTIVFVNTKNDAVSVARAISSQLGKVVVPTDAEKDRWAALEYELGDLGHSLLWGPASAVPHNSAMLRLERDLAERMFKRPTGASIIVATPTLAQGLNLPAHIAILAGDKRSDANQKGRENLEAHEILNAAARAGRAGHLANGVVLLVPEPPISFAQDKGLARTVVDKLKSVLPEDDRCVVIHDPLEIVLDRLMQGHGSDPDVRYIVNRMTALHEADGSKKSVHLFDLRRSYGAFRARQREKQHVFDQKVATLRAAILASAPGEVDGVTAVLASQSGLSIGLLVRLKRRIMENIGALPTSVGGWLTWTVEWLKEDEDARAALLQDVKRATLAACGRRMDGEVTGEVLRLLLPGLLAWVDGKPLAAIEISLCGEPGSASPAKRTCPRARALVSSVIPRSFSFIVGLVSHVVEDVDPFGVQEDLSRHLIECLSTAVRKGFSDPDMIAFAAHNPNIVSRVQIHMLWDGKGRSK